MKYYWVYILFSSCDCAAGYTGAQCQTNIDDCVNNLCENSATCLDLVGGWVEIHAIVTQCVTVFNVTGSVLFKEVVST